MVARKVLATSRPVHERLHQMITANPGIHIRRLAQLVGLSWNTCLHHLRTMESHGTVVSRKVQGRVCYFDKTQGAVAGKEAMCLLREPENLELARYILSEPGKKQLDIARSLNMATSTIHRRVTKMEKAGLVKRLPESRSVLIFPSEELAPVAEQAGIMLDTTDDVFGEPLLA